jgi:acyl-CoA synthetase
MLWEMDLGGAIFATPCIAASLGADEGTHCFATCQTGRLHCIRAADGQPRWTTAPAKFEGHASPAVETEFAHVGPRLGSSMVCAAATDGSLHLFRSSDGLPVLASPLKLPAPIFSSPVLCARRVVVGCRDDALYCIHMESFR